MSLAALHRISVSFFETEVKRPWHGAVRSKHLSRWRSKAPASSHIVSTTNTCQAGINKYSIDVCLSTKPGRLCQRSQTISTSTDVSQTCHRKHMMQLVLCNCLCTISIIKHIDSLYTVGLFFYHAQTPLNRMNLQGRSC